MSKEIKAGLLAALILLAIGVSTWIYPFTIAILCLLTVAVAAFLFLWAVVMNILDFFDS